MVSWDRRIPSSLGYSVFSHPEICLGDQSKISLLVTTFRNLGCRARRHFFATTDTTSVLRFHRYDSSNSRSSERRSRIMLFSAPIIAATRSRLVFCNSRTFSSTVSRAISR